MANNQNPINNMLQFLNSGGNPQQFIQSKLQQNPQLNTIMSQLQNMSQGKSGKEFAMQLAKQNGIDPTQLMQIANKMGLK
ncbi:MAG: hypothetical protein ACI4PF_02325 [Christensenellales bacterium]